MKGSKNRFGFARSLVLACGTLAAVSAPVLAQTTFETLALTQQDEWGTSIEKLGTGYVMAGNISTAAQQQVIVRRTDQFGNAIATAWTYGLPNGNMTAQSVRVARDRTIMVAGELTPQAQQRGIFLMKLNPTTGAVIWMQTYVGTQFTGLGGTVVRELQGAQSGFVLVTRLANVANGLIDGVLITTDANGIQTCGAQYIGAQAGANVSTSFNDVRQNPDGSFTISGFWRVGGQGPRLPLVLRTRCGVPPMWARTYFGGAVAGDIWGEGLDLALSSVTFAPDLTVVTGPWRNTAGQSVGSHQIVLNGSNGVPLTLNGYRNFMEAQSIRVTPGLRSLIAGKIGPGPLPPGALLNGGLMRVQIPGGGVITAREMDSVAFPNGREFLQEAIGTSDGGATATGDAQQYPFTNTIEMMHAKTNVMLTSPDECDMPRQIGPVQDDVNIQRVMTINPIPPQVPVTPVFIQRDMQEPDVCREIHGCTTAPTGLSLWLPLDEVGGVATNMANPAFNGTHFNGPAFVGGAFVANSRFYNGFNTFTQVGSYGGVEPGAGRFSIDAWVNTQGNVPQIIVNKFRQVGAGAFLGYSLYLQNGTLQVALGTGGAAQVFNSGLAVPINAWAFVAFVYNSTTNTVTFYVNNTSVTLPAIGAAGNKNTGPNTPLRVGSTQGVPTSVFRGDIDEVEFFRGVALTPAQVSAIFDAGSSGKCKDACRGGRGAYCSAAQTTTNVTMWVCNYGTAPTSYTWTPQGLGVGVGCSVQGPSFFGPPGGVTPVINPGQCLPIVISVTKPAGMNAAGLTGCFQVEFMNNTTGNIFTCNGTVTQGGPLCGFTPFPGGSIFHLTPGGSVLMPRFVVSNNGTSSQTVAVRVRAEREENSANPPLISLNGLPPGEPVLRTLTIPGNGSEVIQLTGQADFADPLGAHSFILEADLDGDGEWEPLDGAALVVDEPNGCDSIDFNNDTSFFDPLDIDAFLSVFGEGPCIPAAAICNDIDFNNDGSVFDPCDIDSFLTVFGEGPCTLCGV